jgi:2-polyprenyl-3-methyl-5-hydroxy-6-metoxy-1,4-benzoquinol methylase
MAQSDRIEQQADWDSMWQDLEDTEDLDAEERTLRLRIQMELVREHLGSPAGLKVIEIGAGRSTNALLFARAGANATVLDYSPTALEQSKQRFAAQSLDVGVVEADVFDLPPDLRGRFDVSMSFGLCEHFLGERRLGVIKAHLDLVHPGGLVIINVPHRYSPIYRAWMAVSKRRGTWVLGTEVPFSASEIKRLAREAGGRPLRPRHIAALATFVNQGPNNVLRRLGRPLLPVPQVAIPGLDFFAYDLMQPIIKP